MTKPPQTVKGFPEEKDSGVRAKLGGALRVYLVVGFPHGLEVVLFGISLNTGGSPLGSHKRRAGGL